MKPTKKDFCVIVVNYNQEKEAENFLSELKKYWDLGSSVFVDDGSTDLSVEIAKKNNLEVITHNENMGVGSAIRSGIQFAHKKGFKFVVIMSSNGKMMPSEIQNIIDPIISGGFDYVTGSRFLNTSSSPGLPRLRKWGIPLLTKFMNILLGRKFSDITCGFRSYRIDYLFKPPVLMDQAWLNRYELEYYIHYWACQLGLQIKEVPVTIRYDHLAKGRESKIRPIIDWWSMFKPILFLRFGIKK